MKKVFTPVNYAYLTVLMAVVVGMLILNLIKESVIGLFKEKDTLVHTKNQDTQKKRKETTYIIKDLSHFNS